MTEMNSRRLAQTWHFKRYKAYERELREAAARWFSKKGFKPHGRMPYCLPSRDDWKQNIICPDVAEYIWQEHQQQSGEDSFPLHKYLHHGLSSQAMIFNLVGPLICRDDLEPLVETLEQEGFVRPKAPLTAEFEHDDRDVFNEDSGQPTSIDLALHGGTGSFFIEAKLVERDFGGCSVFAGGDCDGRNPVLYGNEICYLHHIGRKYWNQMENFGFKNTPVVSGAICPFISYYQFFREVLFSFAMEGNFILLHDARNPAFVKESQDGREAGLWSFLLDAVPAEHSSKVGRITIQQVVKSIEESGQHSDWINEFKEKYGIGKERAEVKMNSLSTESYQ